MKKFRENELKILYPKHKLDDKYILWVDFNVLYPYECRNAKSTIVLGGKNIVHEKALLSKGKLLIQNANVPYQPCDECWYKTSQTGTTSGIPFVFPSLEKLKKVESITCIYSFDYQNAQGKRCRALVYCAKKVSFMEKECGTKDFHVHLTGTTIPTLLEESNTRERKDIISKYDEVIQILIKESANPSSPMQINSNAIKISLPQEDYSAYLSQRATEDIKKWGFSDDCDIAVLNLFLSHGVYVIYEENSPQDLSSMFSIKE